ncbi:MAG: hypothetical protein NTU98_04105 [Bacteroidetes bacterium]|nr:hypothetical protein [Bacteroidota bacterium]
MVLNSKWAGNPIQLTDTLNDPAWQDSYFQKLPGTVKPIWLYLRNDALNMYLVIDMPDETSNSNSANDYFWLSFDVNHNHSINPNLDVNFSFAGDHSHPGKIGKQFYLGPNVWTGLGSYPGDYRFAFEASPKNSAAHKVWKLRIPLAEFGINLSLFSIVAWMGLRIGVSGQTFEFPANFSGTGFTNMSTSVLVFARNAFIDPALMGPVIAAVGLVPTAPSVINVSTGRATTASGYYVRALNSAFGGMLNLIFNHNTVNGLRAAPKLATKYKVMFGPVGGTQTELRSAWYNYSWVGSDVVLDAFGPDAGGFYTLPDAASQYSIQDLLISFNSALLPNGLYQFTAVFYNAGGTAVVSPPQTLNLYIDNTVPVVSIDRIAQASLPDHDLAACEFATLGKTEGLLFKITVSDPEKDIDSFSFTYNYGNGTGGTIYSDAYDTSKPVGWPTPGLLLPVGGTPWIPPVKCAYAFTLGAYSRTTNGYGTIGYNSVMRMLTIIK